MLEAMGTGTPPSAKALEGGEEEDPESGTTWKAFAGCPGFGPESHGERLTLAFHLVIRKR
jgi:hypothetical protein